MSTVNALYRLARGANTLRYISRSVRTGSPAPFVKRQVRKSAYRVSNRALYGVLKRAGLGA